MRITNNLSIITSTIALCALTLSPAHASSPPVSAPVSAPETVEAGAPFTVDPAAKFSFERVSVATSKKEEPIVETVAPQASEVQAPTPAEAQAPAPVPAPILAPEAPVASPLAPPLVGSGRGAIIAAAARAQLGTNQDCTALVSNALAAAGINFHGWPRDYFSIGTPVSAAQALPGDLIYYANAGAGTPHIAVYIGNGQAVHGGFNGTTVIASAQLGSGGSFIRVS